MAARLSPVKISYLVTHTTGRMVLDVGAGSGQYSQWLAQADAARNVIALDKKAICADGMYETIRHDLECLLPFATELFSTVVAFDIIEHVQRHRQLLQELFRVCMFNGVLIGSVPHDEDHFLPTYNVTFKHRKDLTHVRYYTESSLYQILDDAGFVDIVIIPEGIVSSQLIAEFFHPVLQPSIKKIVGLLRRVGVVRTPSLFSDLFFVAQKQKL